MDNYNKLNNFKLNIKHDNYIPHWRNSYTVNVDTTSMLKAGTNKGYYSSRGNIKAYGNARGRKGSI